MKKTPIRKNKFKTLIVYPNLSLMLVPSIAIAIFTYVLKKQGYKVSLFDTTHYVSEENSSPQNRVKYLQARKFSDTDDLGIKIKTDLLGDFKTYVNEFKPDVLIVSVVEDSFSQALKMLETIKDLNIPSILGGVFPTAAKDKLFKYDAVQFIGLGEGENTIVNFAEAVRLNKPLNNIPNIWGRNEDGTIFKSELGNLVDINENKADYSLFDERRFYRPMGGLIFKTLPFETYRGCPYRCTYCNSPMQLKIAKDNKQGKFLRRKSMDNVKERLECEFKLYKPEFIYFVDDSFLARPEEEIYDFCDMYEKFSLPFWFNTRPENCSPNVLKRLKEVGAYRISFGIECGNEEFRQKILKRKVTNSEIIRRFEIINESNIPFSVNLIIGFPGETRDLVMDTVELTRNISGFDTLTISIFTPYHGTVLRTVAVNNNWLSDDTITTHTTSDSILNMPKPYLNTHEINGLIKTMPLYCYFPHKEWKYIKNIEQNNDKNDYYFKKYSKIYSENFLKANQDDKKIFIDGTSGCKTNSKDSFFLNVSRLTESEVEMLSI